MPTLSELQSALDKAKNEYDSAVSAEALAKSTMQGKHAEFQNCKYKWSIPPAGTLLDINGCDGFVIASQHPGCGKKETCENRVKEYNQMVVAWQTAQNYTNTKLSAYNTAKAALQASPDYNAAQEEQIQSGKTTRVIWIIVGGTAAVLVLGFLFFKFVLPRFKK